jgi:Superfamily I DNA and RNA helicases and helicase subunits
MQLSHSPKSEQAKAQGYAESLLERLMKNLPKWCSRMLTVQYRMNHVLNKWPSESFYEGKLKPDLGVAYRTLIDFQRPESKVTKKDIPVLKLLDTSQLSATEKKLNTSLLNSTEAAIAIREIGKLFENYRLRQCDIGIITPYLDQNRLIKRALEDYNWTEIEVATVDGFQGREKEVIILSLVRNNKNKSVGFLKEYKRLNVAVTRAKRALIIICDTKTIGTDPVLKSMLETCHAFKQVMVVENSKKLRKLREDIDWILKTEFEKKQD